jgi:hypothetical protein
LPTVRLGELKEPETPQARWLVEELWSARAVGILGGPPKSAKTWLGVDLSVSVASGTPALERYRVPTAGAVIYFAAEDQPLRLKERFAAIAQRRGLELRTLDIYLLAVAVLQLDRERDQERLSETIARIRPRLLVLDPLVRMHNLDENSASEISTLLSFLRYLERQYEVAILIVHHTRKQGPGTQAGQGLRGSSDIHAFGDSNLYLRRKAEGLLLSVEHRSAPAPSPVLLELVCGELPYLKVIGEEQGEEGEPLLEEVILCLEAAPGPLRLEDLRRELSVRKQRLVEALRTLVESGRVERSADGFVWRASVDPR